MSAEEFFEFLLPEDPYYRSHAEQRKAKRHVMLHHNVLQWLKAI
jgi:hypothetical protein